MGSNPTETTTTIHKGNAMYTVTKTSWHRRLHDNSTINRPEGLCLYFWQVVWLVFLKGLTWFGIGAFFAFVLFSMASPIFQLTDSVFGLYEYFGFRAKDDMILFLIVGYILWFVVFLVACGYIRERVNLKREARRERLGLPSIYAYQPPKPPGLVRSFIKAHHEKVCPRIEFE